MLDQRRRGYLHSLGVDIYQLRKQPRAALSVNKHADDESEIALSKPASKQPLTAVRETSAKESKPPPKSANKEPAEKSRAVPEFIPLVIGWWQFEDLLLVEQVNADGVISNDCHLLANAIAAALGRRCIKQGELSWPPAGDPNAIKVGDFVSHFIQGRRDQSENLVLILGGDQLKDTIKIEAIHIPALHAMLKDASLKAVTWNRLKNLRRS